LSVRWLRAVKPNLVVNDIFNCFFTLFLNILHEEIKRALGVLGSKGVSSNQRATPALQ